MLPKVHKCLREPTGRPIVSGLGSLSENLCTYVDFLQPLLLQLPSYLWNSLSLIQQLLNIRLNGDTWLVIFDVESLYSNISHNDGMTAISFFLGRLMDRNRMHDSFLIDLLDYILGHNYFMLDRKFYRQVSGTAMGAKCAPSYANLFLGWWEETHVYNTEDFKYPFVTHWFRFIDDILFLLTGTRGL